MFSCTGSVRMLLLTSKMAKIAYPPGEISNVVGEEHCRTNAKIEPNAIKPICTQA